MARFRTASVATSCTLLIVALRLPRCIADSGTAAANVELEPGVYIPSSQKLSELAKTDFDLTQRLKTLIQHHENELSEDVLQIVDMYLEDFANSTNRETRTNVTAHAEQCVQNPLSRLKLIRRVASLFRILQRKEFIGIDDVENLVESHFQGIGPEIISDLLDATDAILQIHFAYNLSATDLASGKLGGMHTGVKLLAFNCLNIGVRAATEGQLALAVEWLKEATRLGKVDGTVDIATVQSELLGAIGDHNWQWENGGLYDQNLFTRPLKSSFIGDERNSYNKAREALEAKHAGKGRNCSYWPMNMWGLCSGKNLHTPDASSHLFCWLEFKAHQVLTVGPLKMEFLTRNPDIVQIYDAFISERQDKFKGNDNSLKNLEVIIASGFGYGASAKENGIEQFQISEVLPGAPSNTQVDALPQEGSASNRDVTLMLNLNNVNAGGYTVFPAALATSVPTQGSAIFWYNALSDGRVDFSTARANCPVILGQKLVAHKWLRFSHGQCLLQPKERFQVPVNGKTIPPPPAFQHELISEQDYYDPKPFIALDGMTKEEYHNRTIRKYAYGGMRSIRSAIRLDWEIHNKVKEMAREYMALDQSWSAVETYLQDFNETAYNSILLMANETERNEAVDRLAGHPLAIYRTMWRFENFVKKWIRLEQEGKLPRRLTDYIQEAYNTSDGPTHKDLEYSIVGMLVMQQVYDLKSVDIAHGMIDGIDMGIQLSAQQCLEIGREAVMQNFLYIAIDWMEVAVSKTTFAGGTATDLAAALVQLEMAKKAHDVSWQRTGGKDLSTYTEPISSVNSTSSNRQTNIQVEYTKHKLSADPEHARVNYYGVCQGKPHQTIIQERSRLFCWYETEADPYWKIGPLKAELLSMHPKAEILQLHGILPKQLIQYLRNDTNKPEDFSLSSTHDEVNPTLRLGATFWHSVKSSQESIKIMKIVQKATGLAVIEKKHETSLQIATYAPGSHYDVHPDTVNVGTPNHVPRIATFMFYLNNVEKGGATAFAQAGVRVPPEAGSAIFWYNLHSNGVLDLQTTHGACPVIFGEKQVATQWLHYGDQNHLQCDVDQNSRIEILVNGKSKYAQVVQKTQSKPVST